MSCSQVGGLRLPENIIENHVFCLPAALSSAPATTPQQQQAEGSGGDHGASLGPSSLALASRGGGPGAAWRAGMRLAHPKERGTAEVVTFPLTQVGAASGLLAEGEKCETC